MDLPGSQDLKPVIHPADLSNVTSLPLTSYLPTRALLTDQPDSHGDTGRTLSSTRTHKLKHQRSCI